MAQEVPWAAIVNNEGYYKVDVAFKRIKKHWGGSKFIASLEKNFPDVRVNKATREATVENPTENVKNNYYKTYKQTKDNLNNYER